MAEKGFGAKEINLIGSSGTPTIESPGNLNLNANNVAISTNVSIGGTLTVSGNISIGGTLTYEDVTNIDSVGIVTAREGVVIPDNKALSLGNRVSGSTLGDLRLYHDTNNSYIDEIGSGNLYIRNNTNNSIFCQTSGKVELYYNGNDKLATTNTGVSVTGTLAATTFSGSGASLTNLPAANLTGTLPAISGANLTGIAVTEAPVTDYTITGDGSHYYFHGGGVDETAGDPDLYLIRGQKYRFNNTTGSSHPFEFRVSSGGSEYSNGVSGDDEGVQFFTVPYDVPPSIVYQCTVHSGMVGNIYISGGQYHTRPNNLCLQYTRSSSNVTTGSVIYNTEVFDVGDSNAYNTSNGEFTAPITGIYRIQFEHFSAGAGRATANIEKSTDGGSSWSVIKIGMRVYSQASGADWSSVPTIYYAQLNANDKFRITHREGTIHLNTPWNHLTVELVQ